MATRTLATGLTTATDVFGTVFFGGSSPGTRVAVPLTTTWTQPAGCTPNFDAATGSCQPPNFPGVYDFFGYYSPGVCFSGFTVGCTADASTVNFETVGASETVGFCVPSGYSCKISSSRAYERIELATSAGSTDYAIQVRWQSTDLGVIGSSASKSQSGSTSTGSSQTSAANGTGAGATQTGGSSSNSTQNGLSTGAIVGIVIAIVALLILAALAAFFILRRKRKARVDPPAAPEYGTKPELDGTSTAASPHAQASTMELDSTIPPAAPTELTSQSYTPELKGSQTSPTELTGQSNVSELRGSQYAAAYELPNQGQLHPNSHYASPVEADGSVMAAVSPSELGSGETAEQLAARQAALEERRQRLLELQQIEQEQDSIRRQLNSSTQPQQPIRHYEMP